MARPHFLRPLVEGPADAFVLVADGAARPVATTLEPALDSASRRRGLLGRDGLPEGAALIIAPSNSVHTFFMRFPIDLIFAARDGCVLKIRHGVPAKRVSGALRAFAVIEMAAGSLDQAGLRVGDRLAVVRRPGSARG
jgi:uncharacterized protein